MIIVAFTFRVAKPGKKIQQHLASPYASATLSCFSMLSSLHVYFQNLLALTCNISFLLKHLINVHQEKCYFYGVTVELNHVVRCVLHAFDTNAIMSAHWDTQIACIIFFILAALVANFT